MSAEITHPSLKLGKRENLAPLGNFCYFISSAIPDPLHHKCRPENGLGK